MKATTNLEPKETWAVLSQALREALGPNMQLERWTSDAQFTEHGKKRVVRFDLEAREAGIPHLQRYRWVGKRYESEENALFVASVLRIIERSQAARIAGLVVPTVLAYHSPHRILFLSYERGESVTTAISTETQAILATIGRALAALHRMQITPPTAASPTTVLADLRWRVEDLSSWLSGEESSLRKAFEHLEDDAPRSPPPVSFVHNDFGPANLLWRANELVVLDFDKCAQGDPALDLGNFLVQLRRRAILHPEKLSDFTSARRALLEAYRHWCSSDGELENRVAWYERSILLKKVHRLWLEGRNQGSEEGGRHVSDARRLMRVFLGDSTQQRGPPRHSASRFSSCHIEPEAVQGR